MRKTLFALAAVASMWTVSASAQSAVRPQWNYEGSAVCPNGYDYLGGLCRARGGGIVAVMVASVMVAATL
jgi:hypothetical protein